MVYLTSEPFSRFYHANRFSCASLTCLIVILGLFIFSGFVAFATNEIGLRRSVYTEQPTVIFKNEIVIYNYENGETLAYSTVPNFNQILDNVISSPSISAKPIDSNHDGKVDTFRFKISFSSDSANLQLSQIYLFFSYELSDVARLELQDFIKIELTSATGIEKAKVIGSIDFKQRQSLSSNTVTQSDYDETLFDSANANYNLAQLEQQKFARNEYIVGNYETVILPALGTGRTDLDIELRVPWKQLINFSPNILENFKFSWIQFLSIFIPFYIIATIGLNFIFRNRLFAIQEVNNLVK